MKAIFVSEKEAREFISRNYGNDAILKNSSIDSFTHFEIDEVPYNWTGETAAFDVNNGEACVGYLECENTYTVKFGDVAEIADSLYCAREIAEEMKEMAEEMNVSGNIIISSEIDGEVDVTEVELYDEDEPAETIESFAKVWNRVQIGRKIRAERERQSMSVRELSRKAGLSKNNIDRIERGDYNYSIDNLKSILLALGLTIQI